MTRRARVEAVLLGTAVGDALGLPLEGLSPKTIAKRFAPIDRYRLLGRTGFVSDDTEQSALVAQALATHPADVAACARRFRRSLLGWFLRLPWGLGLATLRACVRMLLGLRRSGVNSAGNGAAMRSAVLGAALDDQRTRWAFSDALAEVTHVDARAIEGARYVAEVTSVLSGAGGVGSNSSGAADARVVKVLDSARTERGALEAALVAVQQPELLDALRSALALADAGAEVTTAAAQLKTTGYVVHTVPFAAFCFARFGAEPLHALQQAFSAGGDTDSIGAILGAWCGARHGAAAFSPALVAAIHDGPFGPSHLRSLAQDVADALEANTAPRATYSAIGALLRNLALYPVILAHGFRRLFP